MDAFLFLLPAKLRTLSEYVYCGTVLLFEYSFCTLLYHLCERRVGCFSFGVYGAVYVLYAFPTVLLGLSSGWGGMLFAAFWMFPRTFWLIKGIFSPAILLQKRFLPVRYAAIAFVPAVSLVPVLSEHASDALVYGSCLLGILVSATCAFFLFPHQKRKKYP